MKHAVYSKAAISKAPFLEQVRRETPSLNTEWSHPPAAGPRPKGHSVTPELQASSRWPLKSGTEPKSYAQAGVSW